MEPIIILAAPRTGSSMVAGVFAMHGVWTGICRDPDQHNEKGYFENLRIKKYFQVVFPRNVEAPVIPVPVREVMEKALQDEGYIDGPWLWKGSAMYYPTFYEFNPKYVVCYRPTEQIFASLRGHKGLFGKNKTDEELLKFIDDHQAMMNMVPGCKVHTWNVAGGDFSSIVHALKFCGIEPDRWKIRDFVDSDLWHYR